MNQNRVPSVMYFFKEQGKPVCQYRGADIQVLLVLNNGIRRCRVYVVCFLGGIGAAGLCKVRLQKSWWFAGLCRCGV